MWSQCPQRCWPWFKQDSYFFFSQREKLLETIILWSPYKDYLEYSWAIPSPLLVHRGITKEPVAASSSFHHSHKSSICHFFFGSPGQYYLVWAVQLQKNQLSSLELLVIRSTSLERKNPGTSCNSLDMLPTLSSRHLLSLKTHMVPRLDFWAWSSLSWM